MGLLDFLQSASNAVAGNVAGPVDLIALGLNKAGLPIREPVLGSEWMKKRGLMTDVPMGAARIAGETVGLLSPTVIAQKAPQIARGLLQGAENLAAPRTLNPQTGAIVWHGSPHKFDRFDSSKIGTGEGAQAYGHGLYLAESPDVAKSYQATLSGRGDAAGAAARYVPTRQFNAEEIAAIHRAATVDDPINLAARRLGYRQASLRDVDEAALTKAIADVREQAAGSLYKVDLPDTAIAKMLDWDKPLSQQAPEVRVALTNIARNDEQIMRQFRELGREAPANQAYAALTQNAVRAKKYEGMRAGLSEANAMPSLSFGQDSAARLLRQQGIPGIRYLDGGSRGAGQGTSNYVVFPGEEGLLTILERNGQRLTK